MDTATIPGQAEVPTVTALGFARNPNGAVAEWASPTVLRINRPVNAGIAAPNQIVITNAGGTIRSSLGVPLAPVTLPL